MTRVKYNKAISGKTKSGFSSKETKASAEDFFQISFQHIVEGKYCFSKLDKAEKAAVASSIFKRKSMTWNDIIKSPKHGLGAEKISATAIKAAQPRFIHEDVEFYLAFRFKGKSPMVGYRVNSMFYVLWFDKNFNLYNH